MRKTTQGQVVEGDLPVNLDLWLYRHIDVWCHVMVFQEGKSSQVSRSKCVTVVSVMSCCVGGSAGSGQRAVGQCA